jgi:YegS/Rv2252/BmrU family lipid kinase
MERGRAELLSTRLLVVGDRKDGPKGEAYDRACAEFTTSGAEIVARVPLDRLDDLTRWLHGTAEERPVFVAAGGDGTIGSIAGFLANTDAVLGILPLGTSNDVARSLEIPMDVVEAARLIVHGKTARIDVGEFVAEDDGRHIFVHAAALGLNVEFAQLATDRSFRSKLGPFTYVVALALALRKFKPFDIEMTFGNERLELRLLHLSVINAPVFGGMLELTIPGSEVDDRRLDVLAIEQMPFRLLLRDSLSMLRNRRGPRRGIRMMHLREVRIHSKVPLDVTIDGEIAGRVPGNFRLSAEALTVITPRSFRTARHAEERRKGEEAASR